MENQLCVNALQWAYLISTIDLPKGEIFSGCVNALQRAYPISTDDIYSRRFLSHVSMPFNELIPFLRYPLETLYFQGLSEQFLQVIHRIF